MSFIQRDNKNLKYQIHRSTSTNFNDFIRRNSVHGIEKDSMKLDNLIVDKDLAITRVPGICESIGEALNKS